MAKINLDKVTLVSIFVECTLYGLSLVLHAIAIMVLLRRRKSAGLNRPMLAASIVMFTLGTVHVSADLNRLLKAFVSVKITPIQYLSEVNTIVYAIKSTAYAMQTLVGDGFVLYRLFLVWNGDRKVIIPIFICFVASIGVAICTLRGFARASPEAPVFISDLQKWIVSFFSLTLFTNFTCSSLLAARIWYIQRATAQMSIGISDRNIVTAAVVVIESGAIYSGCLVILLSLYLSGSFAQYIMLDAVAQVIGIVFSLIIVRVGLGLSTDATTKNTRRRSFISTLRAAGGLPTPRGGVVSTFDGELDPVVVTITKATRSDGSRTVGEVELVDLPSKHVLGDK